MFWNLTLDGSQNVVTDGASLQSSRTSSVTALAARPGGGFLASSEIYTIPRRAPPLPPARSRAIPRCKFSLPRETEPPGPTSIAWCRGSIRARSSTASSSSGGAVVFVGRDTSGGGAAWTMEGSSIK